MRRNGRAGPAVAACVAAVLLAAGCGGDSGVGKAGSSSTSTPATGAAGGPPPAQLVGTWSVTLAKADLPANPPPELGNLAWALKMTTNGGIGNAPALTILTAKGDQLETSNLSVSGDTLTLSHEECAQPSGGYRLVTSEYRWKVLGKALVLTTVKAGCPDKVASTILGSRPWKRS